MTYLLRCSKFHKIKVGKEAPAPLKGRVFKIETFNISSSALAAEICAGPHNRLLRRQHCSSLCSQSEGHEHVANMASAQRHNLVGFLAVFGRHNIRPPHFASKVSYSVLRLKPTPVFARCPLQRCRTRLLFAQKRAEIFLDFERPTFLPLAAFANNHEDLVFQVVGKIDAAQLQ